MQEVVLTKAIDKENKYYGFKLVGLIFGAFFGVIILIVFNMTAGIVATLVGYSAGTYIGTGWHSGRLQRLIYWNLPSGVVFGNKYLPPSHIRKFM
jgi:type IV conjugative transfer system protein TraL